jgi:hypothetical protein
MESKSIFYLDQDYKVTYWIIRENVKISSQITIPQAIQLLKNYEFDLIISDPQKLAILNPCSTDTAVPFGKEINVAPSTL